MAATLGDRIRRQAAACAEMGSPLYAALLGHAADDYDAGGVTAEVLHQQADLPSGTAVALRFMGALHRLVLTREAPDLATFFPSVGGTADPAGAWSAAQRLLSDRTDLVRELALRPVQTNEVARSAVLLTGLLHLAQQTGLHRVRLLEVGASGGLNLRFDRFRYEGLSGSWGPEDSPVTLRGPWTGAEPDLSTAVTVVERAGCDPDPLDPTSTEGRLALTSFVWADQVERFERLRGALEVAQRVPARVEQAGAADWLQRELQRMPGGDPGVMTVVWHSVVMQYVDPEERERIATVLEEAGMRASYQNPLCRLGFEPHQQEDGGFQFLLAARQWPGSQQPVVIAEGGGHGPPVRLRRTS